MILVDASIWVDHLRRGAPTLIGLLESKQVLTHSFVVGELALGNLSNRAGFLAELRRLPHAVAATDEEVIALVDTHALSGRGIGFVDLHLLAATLLTPDATLWTRDRRLAKVAAQMGLAPINLPAP